MEAKTHSGGTSSVIRFLLVGGGLLPFLASLGAATTVPTPQQVPQMENRPGLVFSQYMVNKGPVESTRYAFARFSFTNAGQESVTVTELVPSCGCLNPLLSKRVFQPGETGDFLLRVDTPNEKPGPREYFVTMKYADPQPREVVLTFKLILPKPELAVEPKALIFYQGGAGQYAQAAITREIVITDHRKTGLRITGVHCKSDLVSAEPGKVDVDDDGNPRMRVNVTIPPAVPDETIRSVVSIVTDDPRYGTLQVPIIVQGINLKPQRTATEKPRAGSANPR